MGFVSKLKKTIKKLGKNLSKVGLLPEFSSSDAFLGSLVAPGLGNRLADSMEEHKKLAQEAVDEQKRANEEARAIAERQGAQATVDNTAEALAESDERKKRLSWLSTIKSRDGGSLLAAAAGSGYKKNKLGD